MCSLGNDDNSNDKEVRKKDCAVSCCPAFSWNEMINESSNTTKSELKRELLTSDIRNEK